jgi:hypothetical protein
MVHEPLLNGKKSLLILFFAVVSHQLNKRVEKSNKCYDEKLLHNSSS